MKLLNFVAAFMAFNSLDWFTTKIGLSGRAIESNPVYGLILMCSNGWPLWLSLLKLFGLPVAVALLSFVFQWATGRAKFLGIIQESLLVCFIAVILNNIYTLLTLGLIRF